MYKKVWKCDKCGNHLWEMVPEQGSTYATAFACDVCDKQAWVFVSCEYFPHIRICGYVGVWGI